MKTFTNTDHLRLLRAAGDPRATQEEREFLGYMAGLAAACEPVSNDEYRRASILAAINLHDKDSLMLMAALAFKRQAKHCSKSRTSSLPGYANRAGFTAVLAQLSISAALIRSMPAT